MAAHCNVKENFAFCMTSFRNTITNKPIKDSSTIKCDGLHTIRMLSISSTPKLVCHQSSNGAALTTNAASSQVIFGTEPLVLYKNIKRKTRPEYKIKCGGINSESLPILTCQKPSKLIAAIIIRLVTGKQTVCQDPFPRNVFFCFMFYVLEFFMNKLFFLNCP